MMLPKTNNKGTLLGSCALSGKMMLVRIIENNAYFRVGYVMQRLAFPLRARKGIRIGLRSVRAPRMWA